VQRTRKRLKFENILRGYGNPVPIFSLYAKVYKHVYGDITKDGKEKSPYQNTICSEAEEGHGDRL